MLRRNFYTLIRNVSFLSPTNVESHNPPLLRPNVLADTSPSVYLWYHLYQPKPTVSIHCPLWLVTYRHHPHGFKTRLLGRGFHTLIRNDSFTSPTDVGSHNGHIVRKRQGFRSWSLPKHEVLQYDHLINISR